METYIILKNQLKFLSWENQIRCKFSSAGYPMRFGNSVINDFESKEHDPMITNYLMILNQSLLF